MVQAQATTWERFLKGRHELYKYRYSASVWEKIVFALAMATLVGLLAQIRIHLPWTPVPITGQTFGVLLAGVMLGKWWGGISMAFYGGLGAAGLPWFNGWAGGWHVISGPTGGYIVGFVLAALFIGFFTDTFINSRKLFPMLCLMLFANFVIIYGLGILWLNIHFSYWTWPLTVKEPVWGLGPYTGKGILPLLWVGVIPFIAGDIIKAVAAAMLTKGVAPKESYNGELDAGRPWRRIP